MADVLPQQKAYNEWLQCKNVYIRSDLVTTTNQNVVAGWGCVATANIKEDTVLFRIPRSACFAETTTTTSSKSDDNDPTTKDTQRSLALYLLKCKETNGSNTDGTDWSPFLNLLTPQTLPWTLNDQLRKCLIGTELELVVQHKLARLKAEYKDIQSNWNRDEHYGRECFTYQEYVDACSIVASHANPWFGVSIVPFNTTLNWGCVANVEFDLETDDDEVIVGRANSDIEKGSELFQSYGDTTAELLYRCGFAPKFEDNSNDSISLFVGDIINVVERLIDTKKDTGAGVGSSSGDGYALQSSIPTLSIISNLESKIEVLQKSGAIDTSPWDGMESILTAELTLPSAEFMQTMKEEKEAQTKSVSGKKRQRDADEAKQHNMLTDKERSRYDDGGISKLIGICLVLLADKDPWQRTANAVGSIPDSVRKEDDEEDIGSEDSASDDYEEEEDDSRSDDIVASVLLSSLANMTPEQSVQLQQLALDVGINEHDPWRALLAQVCKAKDLRWEMAIQAAERVIQTRTTRLNKGEHFYRSCANDDREEERDVLNAIQALRDVERSLLTQALKVLMTISFD